MLRVDELIQHMNFTRAIIPPRDQMSGYDVQLTIEYLAKVPGLVMVRDGYLVRRNNYGWFMLSGPCYKCGNIGFENVVRKQVVCFKC